MRVNLHVYNTSTQREGSALKGHDILGTCGMSVLKIGVLTFHRCINYGSYWQARSLAEGLRARGREAVILDHHSPRVNLSEWKCAYQPTLPTEVPASDYPLYRKKMERFFEAFETLPLSPRFDLEDPDDMDGYDTVVVGSDEVWNLFHPWYGNCSLFYGEGLKTQNLISYAASFGNYPASIGLNEDWTDKLRSFGAISVRDENSYYLVRNAIGLEPDMVLDPCLQFPVEEQPGHLDHLPRRYVAVYGHNFSKAYIGAVRQWALYRGLPLISIGYFNEWADQQWITAGPHEFAAFMAGAEAVATNFFHGCVFALRFQKPFVCATTPYRSHKLQGLVQKVGCEEHLSGENTPAVVYHARLNEPLDEGIIHRVECLRHASDLYLDRALALKQLQCA